jgi:hypothetical protein
VENLGDVFVYAQDKSVGKSISAWAHYWLILLSGQPAIFIDYDNVENGKLSDMVFMLSNYFEVLDSEGENAIFKYGSPTELPVSVGSIFTPQKPGHKPVDLVDALYSIDLSWGEFKDYIEEGLGENEVGEPLRKYLESMLSRREAKRDLLKDDDLLDLTSKVDARRIDNEIKGVRRFLENRRGLFDIGLGFTGELGKGYMMFSNPAATENARKLLRSNPSAGIMRAKNVINYLRNCAGIQYERDKKGKPKRDKEGKFIRKFTEVRDGSAPTFNIIVDMRIGWKDDPISIGILQAADYIMSPVLGEDASTDRAKGTERGLVRLLHGPVRGKLFQFYNKCDDLYFGEEKEEQKEEEMRIAYLDGVSSDMVHAQIPKVIKYPKIKNYPIVQVRNSQAIPVPISPWQYSWQAEYVLPKLANDLGIDVEYIKESHLRDYTLGAFTGYGFEGTTYLKLAQSVSAVYDFATLVRCVSEGSFPEMDFENINTPPENGEEVVRTNVRGKKLQKVKRKVRKKRGDV